MEELTEYRNMDDQELLECIGTATRDMGQGIHLSLEKRIWLRGSLCDSFRCLDTLQGLVDDRFMSGVMVNGAGTVFIERNGKTELWEGRFEEPEQLEGVIQQTVGRINRAVDMSLPIVGAGLEDGSRAHVVLPPMSLDGPTVTIRKFPKLITMEKFIHFDAVTREGAELLQKLVEVGYDIFISGGTSSGKTTLLDALSMYILADERVITIGDSAELQVTQVPNLVRTKTRNVNTERGDEITMSQLIRAPLRMNSLRIIVGEVRGKEMLGVLQVVNTGHAGSLSAGHGNGPRDMVNRLGTMMLIVAELPLVTIRSQIASTLDMVVHLERLRDGSREILSITKIGGCRDGEVKPEPLYKYDRGKGILRKREELTYREKLGAAGCCQRREEEKTGWNSDRTKEGPVN